jgi:hypothetical protein
MHAVEHSPAKATGRKVSRLRLRRGKNAPGFVPRAQDFLARGAHVSQPSFDAPLDPENLRP